MSAYFQDRRIVAASLAVGAVAALLVTPLYPSLRAHVNTLLLQLGITTTRKEEPYDAQLTFEQFLERQAELSWEHLRANIHPKGTAPGCIVASPSKNKPDYWYQMSPFYSLSLCICANQRIRPYWTRDSALVMRAVFQRWQQSKPASEEEKDLLAVLIDFVDATVDMQHRDTPSGGFKDGGLGEVKFHVDRSPYTGPWGRPQRDGPALRATLLMAFARAYASDGGDASKDLITHKLWNDGDGAIKADLDYVASEWKKPDFDLWEESQGIHFYTVLAQLRAMEEGVAFAQSYGDSESSSRYKAVADEMNETLESFWDAERGYLTATINVVDDHGKVSGLDTATIMAVLHSGVESGQWTVDNPKILLTHLAVVESMRNTYALSKNYKDQYAVPMGRYTEDIYDGVETSLGNPWYLCTLYHAEYLYRLAAALSENAIVVPSELHAFYSSLLISPLSETSTSIPSDSPVHGAIVSGLRARADDFVRIVRQWKAPDGSLSEQFSRLDGSPQGAHRLTWSNAALLSTVAARNGQPGF